MRIKKILLTILALLMSISSFVFASISVWNDKPLSDHASDQGMICFLSSIVLWFVASTTANK